VELKTDGYDNMIPSLQLFVARFLNFLLSKLSHDFKLHRMSILQDVQRPHFPINWLGMLVVLYVLCSVHADMTLVQSKVKVTW